MIKKELLNDNVYTTKGTTDEMKKAEKTVQDIFLAALMLNWANRDKYGVLKRSMQENYVARTSKYHDSLEMVLHILNIYPPPPPGGTGA
jgi:hypothetical protein